MKKFLAGLLVLVMAIALVPQGLFTIDVHAATSGDFTYTVNNGGAEITDYSGSGGAVTIPSTLGGYPVTSIGSYAFFNEKSLLSVTIPSSVSSVGLGAFFGCTNLQRITTGCLYKTLSWWFANTPVVTYADNEEYVPRSLNEVVVTAPCTSIPTGFFYDCKIFSVALPDTLISIGEVAFHFCSIRSITIPDSVTTIKSGAFEQCRMLKQVYIGKSVKYLGVQSFSGCDALTSIEIPDSVTEIMGRTFDGCRYLETVKLGSSVERIDSYAFKDCPIKTIYFPSSIRYIGSYAFSTGFTSTYIDDLQSWCSLRIDEDAPPIGNLYLKGQLITDLIIPNSVKTVSSHVFFGCSSLKSVSFSGSTQTIATNAFVSCKNLENIYLPESIEKIESFAFGNCNIKTLYLPASIVDLDGHAFYDNMRLNEIWYGGSPEQKESLCGKQYNFPLFKTWTWHYNICPINDHIYDNKTDLTCNQCEWIRDPLISYGDVSGDYTIDSRDLVLIRKFMANFDYDTNTSTVEVAGGADTNGDGGIDARDLVLLRQYFANYDYDSGSSSVVLGPQN